MNKYKILTTLSAMIISFNLVSGEVEAQSNDSMQKVLEDRNKLHTTITKGHYQLLVDKLELERKEEEIQRIEQEYNRLKQLRLMEEEKKRQEEKLKQEKQRQLQLQQYTSTKESYTMQISHYSIECEGCTGVTASGVDVRNTIYYQGMRIIATDTNIIPMWSIVELELPTGTVKAVVLDRGSAIIGERIDFLVNNDAEAYKLGVYKNVKVNVIRKGK